MTTITLYNHTRARFLSGANSVSDTYRVRLYTAATFNATHTTLAATGGTEVANANGYTTGGAVAANPYVAIVNTSGAKFDADDVTWTATGGNITANYAILYNDTDTDDPPVAFVDFEGTRTSNDGIDFKVQWNADGIVVC